MIYFKDVCPVCNSFITNSSSNPYDLVQCDDCGYTGDVSKFSERLDVELVKRELKKCKERVIELETILSDENL